MLLSVCNPQITSDGLLRLSYPGIKDYVGEIAPWSAGFTAHRVRNGYRVPAYFWTLDVFEPQMRLAGPVSAFLEQIPAEPRDIGSRYRFGQVLMLHSITMHAEARDLARSNPNLLWLLVAAAYDGYVDVDEIPRMCRRKQVDVLHGIVRGADKRALRLVRKLRAHEGTLEEARMLAYALSRPDAVAATAHVSNVDARLLDGLARHPVLATSTLARLLAMETTRPNVLQASALSDFAHTVEDILRMAKALRIERPEQALARCESIAAVRRLHDRWTVRLNGPAPDDAHPYAHESAALRAFARPVRPSEQLAGPTDRRDQGPEEFPSPPVPGCEDIRPITTRTELRHEGRVQRNCIASYASAVTDGRTYVYRVLRPQRATLALRNLRGRWWLGQLKLDGNKEPDDEVKRHVRTWFARHGIRPAGRGGP